MSQVPRCHRYRESNNPFFLKDIQANVSFQVPTNFYDVSEVRFRDKQDDASKKPIKISTDGILHDAEWACIDDFCEAISQSLKVLNCFTYMSEEMMRRLPRRKLNKVLAPLYPALTVLGHLLPYYGPSDPWHMYQFFSRDVERVLPLIYNLGRRASLRQLHPYRVPETMRFGLNISAPVAPLMLRRVKVVLSEPQFPRVVMDVFHALGTDGKIYGLDSAGIHFLDQLILDLEAITHNITPPTYVNSEQYTQKMRSLFPIPDRGVLPRHPQIIPGAFPDVKTQPSREFDWRSMKSWPRLVSNLVATTQLRKEPQCGRISRPLQSLPFPYGYTPSSSDCDSDSGLPLQSLTTLVDAPKPTNASKAAAKAPSPRVSGNPGLASPRPSITRPAFSYSPVGVLKSHRYKACPAAAHDHYAVQDRSPVFSKKHDAVRRQYFHDFVALSPPYHRKPQKKNSILFRRLKSTWQKKPPRIQRQRVERHVRFTDETSSLEPRTHTDSEIPRLSDGPQTKLLRSLYPHPSIKRDAVRRCIDDILTLPSILPISEESQVDINLRKQRRAEKEKEEALIAQEAKDQLLTEFAEQQQRERDALAQREQQEAAERSDGLRLPQARFIAPLSAGWRRRACDILRASPTTDLASTPEGTSLRRHDLQKLVKETEWLNDEIVNGSFLWLDKAVNEAAGIKNVKMNTRKCLSMNSFFWKQLTDKGVTKTQRALRRYGAEKRNFLDIDTIFIPICEGSHWTLLVIRPSKRTVSHMDSMNPGAYTKRTDIALAWIKDILEESFIAKEWKAIQHQAPRQTNGWDCGVHTITNAMCISLGLNPIDCYMSKDLPEQRLRLACMLLNQGFKGDFDLSVF